MLQISISRIKGHTIRSAMNLRESFDFTKLHMTVIEIYSNDRDIAIQPAELPKPRGMIFLALETYIDEMQLRHKIVSAALPVYILKSCSIL